MLIIHYTKCSRSLVCNTHKQRSRCFEYAHTHDMQYTQPIRPTVDILVYFRMHPYKQTTHTHTFWGRNDALEISRWHEMLRRRQPSKRCGLLVFLFCACSELSDSWNYNSYKILYEKHGHESNVCVGKQWSPRHAVFVWLQVTMTYSMGSFYNHNLLASEHAWGFRPFSSIEQNKYW